MKISYKTGDNGLTVGIASYDNEKHIVPGYNNLLVLAIAQMCNSVERSQLLNTAKYVAYSKPCEADEFSEETGRRLVRDKLIIRDAERNILKLSIVEKYLRMYLSEMSDMSAHYVNRMNSAYERLEDLE